MEDGIRQAAIEPLDRALLEAVRDILNHAQNAISDPSLQTDVAVHEFRKSMKQWRAWLRLFEPYLGDSPRNLRALARDTARRLSGPRDLRSAIDALIDLRATARDVDERSQIAIRERLERMREEAETREIDSQERTALAKEANNWLTFASDWSFFRITPTDLLDSITKGYRRARRSVPRDWRSADEEELHELRRRTIDHRYQLELARNLTGRRSKLAIDEAQSLREAIGRHRDLTLLLKLAAHHQPLARFRSKLTPAIARRQKEHLREAAKISERLYSDKPRVFRERLGKRWLSHGEAN